MKHNELSKICEQKRLQNMIDKIFLKSHHNDTDNLKHCVQTGTPLKEFKNGRWTTINPYVKFADGIRTIEADHKFKIWLCELLLSMKGSKND